MPDSTTPPDERILAVDYGTRRIGLALGNARDGLAVSAGIVAVDPRDEAAAPRAIAERAAEEGATRLMIGLPLNMDGTEGPAAQAARALGNRLHELTGLPLLYLDERLTSEAARERLIAAGMPPPRAPRRGPGGRRARGNARPLDDVAATILLQGWFDDEQARRARLKWSAPAT